tara:strand:+ start:831 stop:1340 length:510 start_codon:yes stop_codon:yes gene_type:complete
MAGNKNSGNPGPPKNKTSLDTEKKIVSSLKRGAGVVETATLCGSSKNVVQRIRNENADQLPVWRKNTAETMMRVHSKLLDTLEQSIDNTEPGAKTLATVSISLGILSDKLKDIQQTGPQIVEHRHLHVNHSDVNSLLSDIKSGGEGPKQKESGQGGTQQDTNGEAIDVS